MTRWLGNALIALGLLAVAYGALWQLGIAPGSRVRLPEPVALERTRVPTLAAPPLPAATPTTVPVPAVAPTPAPPVAPTPAPPGAQTTAAVVAPTPALAVPPGPEPTGTPVIVPLPVPWIAPDAADRALDAQLPPPGYAVRLAIPSIKLDTVVKQAGVVPDADGNPTWQTLPFVAVHYGDLTALVGARGNAVIAGHVVTLSEGNVFRFLYQLDVDDEIQVWDQANREHDFHVVDVKLVPPDDTSVMAPTPDRTLTLITCGGTFDPTRREFSDRLIVVAKPDYPAPSG